MLKKFRKGAIGAILDEYEKALNELIVLIQDIPDKTFEHTLDSSKERPDLNSIKGILTHVIRAGYGYSNYVRIKFNFPKEDTDEVQVESISDAIGKLGNVFEYFEDTLKSDVLISESEFLVSAVEVRWNQDYDIEQLLEHAIVHLLRHRRQIERVLQTYF